MTETLFVHLNKGWNAHPVGPSPVATANGEFVDLRFPLNHYIYDDTNPGDQAILRFSGCTRYGFSSVNDEGWHYGQCRFSKRAPEWGEFYEVVGDLRLDRCPVEWVEHGDTGGSRHFLFYFKDETFECQAEGWEFIRLASPGKG